MMLLSPRTAKYVDAMIREGDNFDYRRWLRRVQEEETQASRTPAPFSWGESVASEMGDQYNTPDHLDAWANSVPVLQAKLALRALRRSDQKATRGSPEDRLRQRLVMVCNAWDDFQECRKRDAVYGYLKAVFALVMDHKGQRRTKRLLRGAFQFAGLSDDRNADPFTTVIRCTCERDVDNKTISKWARALRYVAYCKVPRMRLRTFMKKMGGVNSCADRWAQCFGRGGR